MFAGLKLPSDVGQVNDKVIDHELRPFCTLC